MLAGHDVPQLYVAVRADRFFRAAEDRTRRLRRRLPSYRAAISYETANYLLHVREFRLHGERIRYQALARQGRRPSRQWVIEQVFQPRGRLFATLVAEPQTEDTEDSWSESGEQEQAE